MLIELVERACADIDGLEEESAVPRLAEAIGQNASDTVQRLSAQARQDGKQATDDLVASVLAKLALAAVKSTPSAARQLLRRLGDRSVPAPRRCGIASLLAYFVQPHDALNDALPGGYGFIDDAILLHAGVVQYLETLPGDQQGTAEHSDVVGMLISITPQGVRPLIQQAVGSMSQAIQVFSLLGPDVAELTIAQIVANPLQMATPNAPQGFMPQPPRNFQQGFFGRSGAYIEGDNYIMPGGGGLIGGEVFIP